MASKPRGGGKGGYSSLPGQSASHLPLADPAGLAGDESDTLDSNERGRRAAAAAHASGSESETKELLAAETDDGPPAGDEVGLLEGDLREMEQLEEEGARKAADRYKPWYRQIDRSLIILLAVALAAGATIGVLYNKYGSDSHGMKHASAKEAEDYYSGTGLEAGTFTDDAVLAENPIPEGNLYDDIPFASVGASHATGLPVAPAAGHATSDDLESLPVQHHLDSGRSWNGTHWFDKTVIIVSLDGVRADYLEKGLTPHLLGIAKKGLRAEYMIPRFPSLTFPNHWSLQTGLNVESHGIVANDFIDPKLDYAEFKYTDPKKSWDAKWWGGEPMWATAVKNKLKANNMMWPGPPKMKDGTKPTVWFPFQNRYHYEKKVDLLFEWIDMPLKKRPNLVNMYAPEVDQQGHRTGPHSHEVENELANMDDFARLLWEGLAARNLTDIVDVVFVSDHGMADSHNERVVLLDDILGKDGFKGIKSSEGWPHAGLRFQAHIDADDMYARLLAASEKPKSGFKVYTHATMPERFHFSGNERIAPIYVVPHVGWAVSNHHEFYVQMKGDFHPKGNHGYDNLDPSMRAIFVAHGPFANRLKQSPLLKRQGEQLSAEHGVTVIPGFNNTEIYNLAMKLLGVPEDKWAPNNGTVGFWDRYF